MLNVTDCKALGSEVHADNIMNENNQEVLKKQELPSKKSIFPRVYEDEKESSSEDDTEESEADKENSETKESVEMIQNKIQKTSDNVVLESESETDEDREESESEEESDRENSEIQKSESTKLKKVDFEHSNEDIGHVVNKEYYSKESQFEGCAL